MHRDRVFKGKALSFTRAFSFRWNPRGRARARRRRWVRAALVQRNETGSFKYRSRVWILYYIAFARAESHIFENGNPEIFVVGYH